MGYEPYYENVGDRIMILGTVSQPKSKADLVKRIGQLRNIEFVVMEDVSKKDMGNLKRDLDKFVSNEDITVIAIKQRR